MPVDRHPGDNNEAARLGFGVLVILLVGIALGIAHNGLGLASRPSHGLPWIAEDRGEGLPTLDGSPSEEEGGTEATPAFDPGMDDPMGIPGAAASDAGLPDIPDLDRPIQVQLSAAKKFFDAGAALIIDARETEEYAEGHIAGAICMPYDDVITDPARLESVDTGGKPIIVYCGGGTCELSINLGWALVEAGHRKVLVFMGGYPEWEAAGYPVEHGAEEAS